ncbi:MAG: hypothetical protein ACKVQS_13545 [Fimbriimonadaceae bacterium]
MNNGLKLGMIIFGVIMLACCGGFMFLISPVSASVGKKESEAKSFGDNYTAQILKKYDAGNLLALSTNEYKSQFTQAEFQKVLNGNKKALGDYVSGKGRAQISSFKKENGSATIKAKYENRATFQNGKARVRIDLVYQEKKWYIEMFSIEPT